MLSASELKQKCVSEWIALQNDIAVEREETYKFTIKVIVAKLGRKIKQYPEQPEKWYIDEILDENKLLNEIDKTEWYIYNVKYLKYIEGVRRGIIYLEFLENKIKYIRFDELRRRLYVLGYNLVEEIHFKKFFGIVYSKEVIYRVYIKS